MVELFKIGTGSGDEGELVNVLYLDFQQAPDKVLHQSFLQKVNSHDVGADILEIGSRTGNRK